MSEDVPMAVNQVIQITVHGIPAPQGSKRAFRNEHTGRIQQVESSKKVKPWREAVRLAALAVIDDHPLNLYMLGGWQPLDGPLVVGIRFQFTRPKGHYRTGRNAHLLRDAAPMAPAGKPDVDKLARSTFDALTSAGLWRDDAQVTTLYASKRYAARPGAVIRVWWRSDVPTAGTPASAVTEAPSLFDEPAAGTETRVP